MGRDGLDAARNGADEKVYYAVAVVVVERGG
jgi:hypothetical protein